jgi:putative N-acetylmannosamine-6-phosphate epimerase
VQTLGVAGKNVYLRVSGRGNVNEITKEEAIEIIGLRKGYIEDSDLRDIGPNDDPEIPYNTPNCDF